MRRVRDLKRSSRSHIQKLYILLSPYNSVKQKIFTKISFLLSCACQIRRKNTIFLTKRYPLIASALISHLYKPPVHGTGAVTQSQWPHSCFRGGTATKCCSLRNFPLNGHVLGCSGECQECPRLADGREQQITHTLLLCAVQLCPQATARACVWNITAQKKCLHTHLGPEWAAVFIKYDLLNTPEQRIPSSNSWTDSSDFARSLRREQVYCCQRAH